MSRRAFNNFVYGLLRLGILVYFFPVLIDLFASHDTMSSRIIIISVFSLVALFIIVISKENLGLFGFLIVAGVSIYEGAFIAYRLGLHADLALHFFVLCISIYFVTREARSAKR